MQQSAAGLWDPPGTSSFGTTSALSRSAPVCVADLLPARRRSRLVSCCHLGVRRPGSPPPFTALGPVPRRGRSSAGGRPWLVSPQPRAHWNEYSGRIIQAPVQPLDARPSAQGGTFSPVYRASSTGGSNVQIAQHLEHGTDFGAHYLWLGNGRRPLHGPTAATSPHRG
eukprot:TRINITY_DN12987_c0_g1_i1.p1 TRINITY_DN12987_c0_g1~~TRINITY_DN12987_c0_g1_i1.p1  ORF type:complete len:191 (+),score=20.28 TRINITY_DN12987_c0_g1_i1:70-573(+)